MEAVRNDAQLTAGERSVETRVLACAAGILNGIGDERNARVIAAAWLTILQDNPEISTCFEELCGKWMVKQVVREGRLLGRELTGKGR